LICPNCNASMKKIRMVGDITGMGVYLVNKEKGLLGMERRSNINTFVCPKCGKLELVAENPDVFS